MAYEEVAFGLEAPGSDGVIEGPDEEREQTPPGIRKITSDEDCRDIANATKCIAFVQQIKDLARINIPVCREKSCDKPTDIEESYTGSALYLKWVCNFLLRIWVMKDTNFIFGKHNEIYAAQESK